jgi:hypothetical protein
MNHVTFPVATNIKPNRTPLPTVSFREEITDFNKGPIEARGCNYDHVLMTPTSPWKGRATMNGFLRATHEAFASHYPLILSPDDVWLAIAQGFANHVNANAEKIRDRFVQHEGQKHIEIEVPFRKGSPDNDWPSTFAEFATQIGKHIGDEKRQLVVNDFSTTGPVERAVSQIVLMDAMKPYVSYGVRTQDPDTKGLRPSIGWAITDRKE